jgi:hypothetical protein
MLPTVAFFIWLFLLVTSPVFDPARPAKTSVSLWVSVVKRWKSQIQDMAADQQSVNAIPGT